MQNNFAKVHSFKPVLTQLVVRPPAPGQDLPWNAISVPNRFLLRHWIRGQDPVRRYILQQAVEVALARLILEQMNIQPNRKVRKR